MNRFNNIEQKQDNTKVDIKIPILPDNSNIITIGNQRIRRKPQAQLNPKEVDLRTDYQKKQDQIYKENLIQYNQKQKNQENALNTLGAFTTFIMPSTHIGPLFRNNGKSYTDNWLSGDGSGNIVGNVAIDMLTPFAIMGINKGIQAGNKYYKMYQIFRDINKSSPKLEQIPLNVGWGPKQTIAVSHSSDTGDMQLFFPKRWDVVNEGANPHGIWYQGKLGTPRTDFTNPGKGTKAAKARSLFSNRPVQVQGNLTLEKPMITVGNVQNRSQLSYYSDNAGADGLVYNGVYDNGYNNNQVILSFKKVIRSNGKPFGKLTFKNGEANVDGLYKKIGEGSEAVVYEYPQNQNKVLKIYTDYPMNPDQAADIIQVPRNKVPFQEPLQFEGLTSNGFPVFSQNKVTPLTNDQWTPDLISTLQEMFKSKGYTGDIKNSVLSNEKIKLLDISPQNIGYNSNGELRMIDIFPDVKN